MSSERTPFLPLLLVTVAWLVSSAFQTDLLITEHRGLERLSTLQRSQLEQEHKLENSYLSLIRDTEALAAQGDASAKLVIEQLKARGIQLPPAKPTGKELPVPPAKPTGKAPPLAR